MSTTVLVLNASWEPISHTKLARAVAMVQSGVAVIHEEHPDRILRSANDLMPLPKIIRLLKYVKVKRVHATAIWSRRGVLLRDRYKCVYCGGKANTCEHIIPESKGGPSDWMNTAAACVKCNNKKDDRTLEESGMKLLFQPWVPMKSDLIAHDFDVKLTKGVLAGAKI